MQLNFYCLSRNSFFSSILLIFLISFQSITFAQSGTIRGTVTDKTSNEALIGANIVLQGTSLGAATDIDGNFIIYNVPAGTYTIIVSYIGYQPSSSSITVSANRTIERDFILEYQTIEGETVTITAQAEGQLDAINQQLNTNTIANIVAKDRIKELPDVNAAETIGRLPGVSIQRYGGEATKVEVRGLSPKYSLVTVNGIELPATGTEDRSVDLSLVSSNMLDGIILKKSITPDMDADVLGGTIDLRLKEAPKNLQVNLSAQGGYNELQDYYGNYNFTASVSNRFLDGNLGIILNGNADNYDRSADKFRDNWRNYNYKVSTGELLLSEERINRKRYGASMLIDYTIPNGKLTANGFFNQLNSENLLHINQATTAQNGYSTLRLFYDIEENKPITNVYTSAIGINQDFGWIRYDFGASRSGTASSDPDRRRMQFTQEQSGFIGAQPYMHPRDLAQTINADTLLTNLASLYSYGTRTIENSTSALLNFQVPFVLGDQLSGYFKTGAKLSWVDRSNDERQYGNSGLQYGSGITNPVFLYLNQVYPEWNIDDIVQEYGLLNVRTFLTEYNRSNFLNGEYPLGFFANKDMLNAMVDALSAAPADLRLWLPYSVGTFGNDYKGFERYEAAYIMGEFNLGDYLTVIPGVRWEEDFSSYHGQRYRAVTTGQGTEQPPADFTRISKVRRNNFWLPMVNIIVKPIDWLQLKLARTESLARPDYIRYAPITYINGQNDQIEATNYYLKPSHSTNYDAGFSIFNNEIGLLAVNGFYKKIDDLIFYQRFPINRTGGIFPDPALEIPDNWYAQSNPVISFYQNNPDPAEYSGYEIEWQTHFWYLPSVLSGLVLNINYTHIYSEMVLSYDSLQIRQVGPRREYSMIPKTVKTRMPDQPAHILNVTIGYDLGGFSARVSYLYQTDKLTGIGYDGNNPTGMLSTYTGSYGRWDLTLQQKIFQHFQLFANFNNLNNRHDENFIGSDLSLPSYIEYYGFTMDLGVRYNL